VCWVVREKIIIFSLSLSLSLSLRCSIGLRYGDCGGIDQVTIRLMMLQNIFQVNAILLKILSIKES